MKKFLNLTLAAALAFGLAACQKTNNGQEPDNVSTGNTKAGLTVAILRDGSGLKAETNVDQRDEKGLADESAIAKIDIVGGITQSFATKAVAGTTIANLSAGNFSETADGSGIFNTAAFEATTGSKSFGVVLNNASAFALAAGQPNAIVGDPTDFVPDIKSASTPGSFPMTSKVENKTIVEGIDAAASIVDENSNLFEFNVERIVAQGIVQAKAGLKGETTDGSGTVKTSDLTYAAINGATRTYYMANNAGSRTLDDDPDSRLYTGFKSAVDGMTFAEGKANTAKLLVRLGNAKPATGTKPAISDLGNYARKPVKTDAYDNSNVDSRGIYFFENSYSEQLTDDNKKIGFYRLPYAKVYATFTPTKVYKIAEADADPVFKPAADTNIWWYVETFKNDTDGTIVKKYSNRTISDDQSTVAAPTSGTTGTIAGYTLDPAETKWVEGRVVYVAKLGKNLLEEDTSFQEGDTFYYGQDGRAYSSIVAAQSASNQVKEGHYQLVNTYTDGKCAYRALWNKQFAADGKNVINAAARRNNIYHLTIEGFATIGMNWDESDPNDPYLPQPTDPDENPNPKNDNPHIQPTKALMAVKATVLKWNYVARTGIILQ